jgi:excinuclease ABC subunit C
MDEASQNLQFERAARLRDRIVAVEEVASRQKVISEIMTGVDRVRIDTERNFL